MICGNKCDLVSKRVVSTQEGADYAKKIGWPFFEMSAKLNLNISEAFLELVRQTPCLRDNEYNVRFQGAVGVGKSSICIRFVAGLSEDNYYPTIVDSYRKQVVIKGIPQAQKKEKGTSEPGRMLVYFILYAF